MSRRADHLVPKLGLRGLVLTGIAGLVLLVAIFGVWAKLTRISGAVIASGEVVVAGRAKLVQSLDGGIARTIAVRNGDQVIEGQLLMRLDPTLVRTNLDIARARLASTLALQARLDAERAEAQQLAFHYPTLPFPLPDTAAEEAGQLRIFEARQTVMAGSRTRLVERLAQFDSQISGIRGQIAALQDQIDLTTADLDNQEQLAGKGLTRQSMVRDLQRRRAELRGQLAALEAEEARLNNARQDAEIEAQQAERSFAEQVVTELRSADAEVEELILQILMHSDQLERTEIRAPATGVIHELQVTTPGGVVPAGQTIAQVVPLKEGMEFELRVEPQAIDRVFPGQTAHLVIAALDARTTPKIEAVVANVSAGTVADSANSRPYYRVGLSVPPEQIEKLGPVTLAPGMPVEAFLQTTERTVLSYLLQPVTAQLRHAFRD